MNPRKPGKTTSAIEIHTSPFGIWLLVNSVEYFLPFSDYPWFLKATLAQLYQVELHHQSHLHWPDLDVDLDIDSLDNPEKYPLIYKNKE